tara:strand:+ start:250 stop:447 length:198 start_codon:yes stop_codon:yes gene_type:complete
MQLVHLHHLRVVTVDLVEVLPTPPMTLQGRVKRVHQDRGMMVVRQRVAVHMAAAVALVDLVETLL